jgi:hypothetical protein
MVLLHSFKSFIKHPKKMRQTSLAHYDVVQDGKDHKVKHPVFTEQLLSNQLQTNLDKREHTRHLI